MEKIEEEVNILRSVRCYFLYDGSHKRIDRTIIATLFIHADQPERREIYGLKLGKGINHARWRY